MPMPGGIDARMAARMGGGGGGPPGGPPGIAGPPPMAGAGPMGGGPMGGGPMGGGGGAADRLKQLLAEAVMLTKQAGPEAFIKDGLGDLWKGAFGVLDKSLAPMREQLMGGQQGGMGAQPAPGPMMGPGGGAAPPPMR